MKNDLPNPNKDVAAKTNKPRVDIVSGVSYDDLSNTISGYYADITYNSMELSDQQLDYFTIFVKDIILPCVIEKDSRFKFKEVIYNQAVLKRIP